MSDITKAIKNLRPNAFWTLNGDDYSGLEWHDKKQSKPSQEELDIEIARLKEEYEATEYQRLRQPEYPQLSELADAIYWQSQGDETKMTAYLAKVEAVKQKYPKE